MNGTSEVENVGAWVQVKYKASPKVTLNLHWGTLENEDNLVVGDMNTNDMIGANVFYSYSPMFTIGLEVDHFETGYFTAADEDMTLVWLSISRPGVTAPAVDLAPSCCSHFRP